MYLQSGPKTIFIWCYDNATFVLRLDILDNTDHIGLVEGRVTTNEADIRFSLSKLSNIIFGYFSITNLRVDENKAYIAKLLITGTQCGYRQVDLSVSVKSVNWMSYTKTHPS